MNLRMKKRLEKIEREIVSDPSKNGIVFIPFENESDEEFDSRIALWKAGSTVNGTDKPYVGNEGNYRVVRFVSP